MDATRRQDRSLLTFLLVCVLVVASVAVLSLNLEGHPRPSTPTLAGGSTFSYDYDPSLGLNLTISVEPIHAAQGLFVSIDASITNPSPAPIVLQVSSTSMKVSPGPCSQLPLGVGILQGYYGPGNFSESVPLTTFYPGGVFCPVEFNMDKFSFAPRSQNVTSFSLQPVGNSNLSIPQSIWTQAAEIKTQVRGFWTDLGGHCNPANSSCPYPGSFRSFLPGLYSVLAQDQWGQAALAHFEVTGDSAFAGCSSVTSSSAFIKHSAGKLSSGPFSVSTYYIDRSDNGSVFLPLTNEGSSPMTLTGVEDPFGHFLYNYQGNAFPPQASFSWYAVSPREPLEYPFSAPGGACSLLHVDLSGSDVVGTELRFFFAGGGNETIKLGR